jgi:hypothetical protein
VRIRSASSAHGWCAGNSLLALHTERSMSMRVNGPRPTPAGGGMRSILAGKMHRNADRLWRVS